MASHTQEVEVLAVQDASRELPIPTAWRPAFREIVKAFVRGDFGLSAEVAGVAPVSADTAAHIDANVRDYGASLVELPEETWDTSVCMWSGLANRWDVLVDLWTREEGRSDLVLDARVVETAKGSLIEIHLVYVP